MQTALIYRMEEQERNSESQMKRREDRYRDSQDDVSSIRKELHKLIEKTGELNGQVEKLTTALTGNDLGTDGLVAQVRENVEQILDLSNRVENMERVSKINQRYFKAFIAAISAVLGYLLDRLFKK